MSLGAIVAGADAWSEYAKWNSAVAAVIYPESEDAGSAYLDLEEDILAEIARVAECRGDPTVGLRDAVVGVVMERGRLRLDKLTAHRKAWMRDSRTRREPPPVLAFLAVTVLAAEQMGTEGSAFSMNAYYPQFAAALGLGQDKSTLADVQKQYSARAEDYWGALNWWLEECNGKRGLPTAYALSHRYVGLPLSQALVRDGDRRKFRHFFVKYGLAPGMEIGGQDLEAYLGEWFTLESCPASKGLQKLWARESTRARIADVVALELAAWDGSLDDELEELANSGDAVRLLADLRQGFFGTSLHLMLSLHAGDRDSHEFIRDLKDQHGEWVPVAFAHGSGNLRVLPIDDVIDPASVLNGVVELHDPESPDAAPLRRHPRAIIPLVFDEVQQAFVERERLQLNTDAVLLVSVDGLKGTLVSKVEDVLHVHARPGWTRLEGVPGVPRGWVAFAGVQLFTAPNGNAVTELVPLARDLLTLAGGIRIPSRIRKWSHLAPPEIRVSLQQASDFEARVVSLKDDALVQAWTASDGALVVDLAEVGFDAGDYRVELRLPGAKDPIQQATLRLRSGETHEALDGDDEEDALPYSLSVEQHALGVLGVRGAAERDADVSVTGIYADGSLGIDAETSAPKTATWMRRDGEATVVSAPIRIADPDPKSCVRTGAHFLVYPTFGDGPKQKYISGECKYCGVMKRSPGWAWKATKKELSDSTVTPADVTDLPPVARSDGRLWTGALDALRHLRAGTSRQLTNLSTQIEPGALFGGTLAATFESLGHIDVARDPTGVVQSWAAAQAQLAVRGGAEVELIGHWPREAREWLVSQAERCGATTEHRAVDGQPARELMLGLTDDVLDVAYEEGITVVDEPGWRVLQALPPVSAAAEQLPRSSLPGFTAAERFDTERASWIATTDVDRPGAYRLRRGFERNYVLRTSEDVARRQCAPTGVHFAKYAAACAEGQTLAAYLASKSTMFVPRGCEIPGLYGRAAVLASGELPRPARITVAGKKREVLGYTGIDQPLADLLHTLLTS